MTPADLDAKARRMARSLAPWLRRANEAIDGKVSDSAAHMGKAVTDALRATADGRPSLARLSRSPSMRAALSRLDELVTLLAGSSSRSLDGLIRDAREAFYRESFAEWKPFVPRGLWVSPDPEPTKAGVAAARGMTIHGEELRHVIAGAAARPRLSIVSAVNLAGRRSSTDRLSANVIATWRTRTAETMKRASATALSDSQVAADVLAGRDLIHDDFLRPIPVPVGA